MFQPQRLLELLRSVDPESGVHVRSIRSFDSGSSNPQDIGSRLVKFGMAAAGRVEELLLQEHVTNVGVTFGETATRVVDGLATLNASTRPDRPIQFMPVCGELVRHSVFEFSSTRLAYRLREIINEGKGESLSLAGIPAYLPRAFFAKGKTRTTVARVIKELLSHNSTYRKIFLADDPLVQHLDALLTSVGPSERTLGLSHAELLEAAEMSHEDLRALIVGDIGGVLIDRRGAGRSSRKIAVLNDMWSGIHLNHIVDLARRAEVEGKPGVVIVAIGADKAPVVKEIVLRGWANEIIVDRDLEKALVQVF